MAFDDCLSPLGSFHLLKLWMDEYLFHYLENKMEEYRRTMGMLALYSQSILEMPPPDSTCEFDWSALIGVEQTAAQVGSTHAQVERLSKFELQEDIFKRYAMQEGQTL
jgi:hypothetical protein